MSHLTVLTIKDLIKLGTNLDLSSDTSHTVLSIEGFIKLAVEYEVHLTISSENFTTLELKKFAKLGQKNLTIIIN